MAGSSFVCLLALLLAAAHAHVCLVNPVQRGGFDISEPGADACFEPQGPCGTVPVGAPVAVLTAGVSYNVLFQQNLNHYNPGWQGTLDVAFGTGFNQTSDNDFTIVAVVPDFWAHLQASQTNFTVAVPVPSTPCDHCVLRVRYVPNKPTEPIFHQCSDVTIAAPTVGLTGQLFAIQSPNMFSDPALSMLVTVGANGRASPLVALPDFFLSQGLVAADVQRQKIYFIGDNLTTIVDHIAPNQIYTYDIASHAISSSTVYRPNGGQWNALLATGGATNNLLVVGQIPGSAPYTFMYQLRYITADGHVSSPIATTSATDTFVNFLWAAFDPQLGRAYILGGDENSLVSQDATLYTIDVASQTVLYTTLLPGPNFTLVSLRVVPGTKTLFAFSPGQTPASPLAQTNWSLVSVDPSSGAVTAIAEVAPWGQYAPYYGGSVYGGMTENGLFLHVFRQPSGGSDLVAVSPSGRASFVTGVNRGVNGVVQLDGYIYVPLPSK